MERLENVDVHKIRGAQERLQDIMNRVQMREPDIYLVDGGTLHALLEGLIFEGSYNPHEMKKATKRASDWGRGRETQPRETVGIAEDTGKLRAMAESEFTSKPVILKQENHSKLELLWARPGGIFERFKIAKAISSERVVANRQHALYLRKGKVKLIGDDNREIATLEEGTELLVPSYIGGYTIEAIEGPAEIYMWYSPLRKDRAVYGTYDALQRNLAIIQKLEKPVNLLADSRMYTKGNARREAQRLHEALGVEVDIKLYDGTLGLSDAAKKTFEKEGITILLATAENLERADLGNEKVKHLLATARKMPPLPELESLMGKGWFFAREVEGAAVLLAATTADNIKNRDSIAQDVRNLVSQFTGRSVNIDDLLLMMPFSDVLTADELDRLMENPKALSGRIRELIDKILMTMPLKPYDAGRELHKRREVLWSV